MSVIVDKNVSILCFCRNNNISHRWFINYLKEKKYVYIQYYGKGKESHKNIAFPKYDTEEGIGFFEMNKRENHFNKGKNNVNIQLTPKGQEYFIDLLEKEGVLNGSLKC